MEIMLKNKCCLYVIISIRFFSIAICNLLIEFLSYNLNFYIVSDYTIPIFVQSKYQLIIKMPRGPGSWALFLPA